MKVLVFYHGNCADGFGAAWVVRKYFKDEPNVEIEFISSVYQQTDPIAVAEKSFHGCETQEIYVVDFSFSPEQMVQLCDYGHVIHIDHHKTAIEKMDGIEHSRLQKYYTIKYSGAMLTWMYLFNDDIPPPLLQHIEDRDLWKFALPWTREIQAALFSFPYDFEIWDDLMQSSYQKEKIQELTTEGAAIERKHFKDIHELLPIVTRPMVIGGVSMPVANLPYIHSSDAGHILSESSASKCAGCYWDTPEGRIFSLRSSADGPDVSAIAKQYGGGGHKNAAGFKISPLDALSFEKIEKYDSQKFSPEAGETVPEKAVKAANVWGQFFIDNVVPF